MDGIEGLFIGLAALVEAIVALCALIIELVVYLVSYLLWFLFRGRREKPVTPKWNKGNPGVNPWPALLSVLVFALTLGGFVIYEQFFKARISFISDSPIPSWFVQYELRSDSGRVKPLVGSEEYATFRWDTLVVTDERYESLSVPLLKKDQVISLESRRLDKLKEEISEKALEKSKSLFEKAKERLEEKGNQAD